jgi:alcohol dehydrogenase YqhD (iron-dependent ADH family)
VKNAALPLVAITTTAGTGSEVDAYGVITKPDTNVKVKHFFHDFGKNFFLSAVRTFLVGTVNRILS